MSTSQGINQQLKNFDTANILNTLRVHAFPGLWLWGLTVLLCLADVALINANPLLTFTFIPMIGAIYPLVFVPILIWRLSKITEAENPKYVRMMRCGLMILFLIPTMTALAVFNHVVMAYGSSVPMVDDLLTSWDRALGFDWLGLGRAISSVPLANLTMDQIYQFMLPALIMVGLHAIIVGRSDRAAELLALVITSAIFTVSLAYFFPAVGAMDHLAGASFKALFSKDTGDSFVPQLLEIRSGVPVLLDPLHLAGISQFPSFHCVCGVLTIYGSRSAWSSQVIATIFGMLLIAATPTFGGHYLVDLIAGATVAISFILIGQKIQKKMRKA